jgi:hypothetical protein
MGKTKFEDKVRKHLGKKPEGKTAEEESKRRDNLIVIIEQKINFDSIDLDKVSTGDLFKIANALTKDIKPEETEGKQTKFPKSKYKK